MSLMNQLDKFFTNSLDKELVEKAILNYKDVTEKEVAKLKNLERLNRIEQAKKLSEVVEKTTSYISFYSFAITSEWELSPIKKSLEALSNVKNCYLLATAETIEKAEEEKKKLEKSYKRRDLKVEVFEVSSEEYENIYNSLEKIVNNSNNSPNDFIIDYTLGFRIISGVFYKFAVEQGIKLISWQTEHCSVGDRIYRIPATDRLNFIEFPQLRNYTTIKSINSSIKKFNFKESASLCRAINNFDRAYLLENLSKVFTLENMINDEDFLEEIEDFCDISLEKIKNKVIKNIASRFKKVFKEILDSKEEEKYDIIYPYIGYIFIKEFFKDEKENSCFFEIAKEKYFESLKDFNFEDSESLEGDLEYFDVTYERNTMLTGDGKDDLFKIISSEVDLEDTEDIYKLLTEFKELIKFLPISLPKMVYLEGDKLYIKKYNIEIKLFGKFIRKSTNVDILKMLLGKKNYTFSRKEICEFLELNEITSKKYLDLRKFIKEFNELILDELKKQNIKFENEFIPIEEKLNQFKELKIAEEYIL